MGQGTYIESKEFAYLEEYFEKYLDDEEKLEQDLAPPPLTSKDIDFEVERYKKFLPLQTEQDMEERGQEDQTLQVFNDMYGKYGDLFGSAQRKPKYSDVELYMSNAGYS